MIGVQLRIEFFSCDHTIKQENTTLRLRIGIRAVVIGFYDEFSQI